MSAITNAFSEKEAGNKIIEIIPDPMVRRIGLEMMADAILFANSLSRDFWAITNTANYPDSLWLQVGHYAVLTLEERQIWLSLDKQLVETSIRQDMIFTSANRWGWRPQVGGLDQYKDKFQPANPFSINGYYLPVSATLHNDIFPELKRLHFEFLYKIFYIGQSIHDDTKKLHLPGVLMYLRNELGKHVPDPLYHQLT